MTGDREEPPLSSAAKVRKEIMEHLHGLPETRLEHLAALASALIERDRQGKNSISLVASESEGILKESL